MADDANYVSEMDISLPTSSDSVGAGDDEIRAVKRAVTQTLVGDLTPEDTTWTAAPLPARTDDPFSQALLVGPITLNAVPGAIADLDARVTTLEDAPAVATDRYLPTGMIAMWSGTTASIPTRWQLCDGTNGTPDLRSRFIVGAGDPGAQYEVGETGGAEIAQGLATSLSGGVHGHTVTVDGHALTESEMPLHGHPYRVLTFDSDAAGSDLSGAIVINNTSSDGAQTNQAAYTGTPSATLGQQIGGTGGGAAHTHTASVTDSAGHTHQVDVRPPWYALAFIMYMGPAA